MLLEYYLKKIGINNKPDFLDKYLQTPSLIRLKNIGYFCGMDYASKDIYDFKEYITRYDHSLSVALLTWKYTKNIEMTLAGLFHDIATPCFSHVIDYMNKDYEKQESTEEFTEKIMKNDKYICECLSKDNISVENIINFKRYSIVDNERPKVCADRIDGVILTGISWTKNVDKSTIDTIIDDIVIDKNEENHDEIGFKSEKTARLVIEISKSIDLYCHSNEDNYMMELLAEITRTAIKNKIVKYEELYVYNEKELFDKLEMCNDKFIIELLDEFKNITKDKVPKVNIENIKIREISPLVNGKRIISK